MKKLPFWFATFPFPILILQACSGSTSGGGTQAEFVPVQNQGHPLPEASPPPDKSAPPESRKDACGHDLDRGNPLCLGVRYVVYESADGSPVLSREATEANLEAVNRLWAKCDISFHLGEYQSVASEKYGLSSKPADSSELTEIRKSFEDDSRLLIVTTGNWDRSGTLGSSGANAWTSMPGSFPYGAVIEQSVASFANIIAHELGHYLGLDHSSDKANLMSPLIYDDSIQLTTSECTTARTTTQTYWSQMID